MAKTTLDYFPASFVQKQRKLLEKKVILLEKKQAQLAAFPDIGNSIDDAAQETAEFENNLILKNNVDNELKEVRAALKRIERGTYGICIKTKQPIERGRLELIPEARYAVGAEE